MDKTFVPQQEETDILIKAGRACNRGSSSIKALSLKLKDRAVHILEEPPEIDLSIDDSHAR